MHPCRSTEKVHRDSRANVQTYFAFKRTHSMILNVTVIDGRAGSLLKSDKGQQDIHVRLLPQIREYIIDQPTAAAKEICRQVWQC